MLTSAADTPTSSSHLHNRTLPLLASDVTFVRFLSPQPHINHQTCSQDARRFKNSTLWQQPCRRHARLSHFGQEDGQLGSVAIQKTCGSFPLGVGYIPMCTYVLGQRPNL